VEVMRVISSRRRGAQINTTHTQAHNTQVLLPTSTHSNGPCAMKVFISQSPSSSSLRNAQPKQSSTTRFDDTAIAESPCNRPRGNPLSTRVGPPTRPLARLANLVGLLSVPAGVALGQHTPEVYCPCVSLSLAVKSFARQIFSSYLSPVFFLYQATLIVFFCGAQI